MNKRSPNLSVKGDQIKTRANAQNVQTKPPPSRSKVPATTSKPNTKVNQGSTVNPSQRATSKGQTVAAKTNQPVVSSLPRKMEDLMALLEELKRKYAEIKQRWEPQIERQKAENESSMNKLLAEIERKIKEIEDSFNSSASNQITPALQALKDKADRLQKEGNTEESQQAMREYRNLETQMIDNSRWSKMHELEARKDQARKMQAQRVKTLSESNQTKLDRLIKGMEEELHPIAIQIEEIEKRLHGDQAKLARSPLCKPK